MLTPAGFFVPSPLILSACFAKPAKQPWRLVLLVIPVGSRVLVNATEYFYYEHLGVHFQSRKNPPQALVDRRVVDGAKRVIALFLGWLYGFIKLCSVFFAYLVACLFRRKRQNAASVA